MKNKYYGALATCTASVCRGGWNHQVSVQLVIVCVLVSRASESGMAREIETNFVRGADVLY